MIEKRGHQLPTDGDFTLTKQAIKEMIDLCLMTEEDLNDVMISRSFQKIL